MSKKAFLVQVERCSGCSLCLIACKDEHVGNSYAPWTAAQPDSGHFWMNVVRLERGKIPRVSMSYLPLFCQHCENAPCIKACSEDAIKRRPDGLVWIDPGVCNGCGLCQQACPYEVIYMNGALGIAQKCTGCAHRVDEGLPPRCVDVCPHEAIIFADVTDPVFTAQEQDRPNATYCPEYQTKPLVLWRGLPKPAVAGIVIDAGGDEVVAGAEITSVDLFDDRKVTGRSDEFGDFWIRNLARDRKYRIEISKQGFQSFRTIVTTDSDQDLGAVLLRRTE